MVKLEESSMMGFPSVYVVNLATFFVANHDDTMRSDCIGYNYICIYIGKHRLQNRT